MAETVETAIYKLRVEGEEDILALTRSINELGEAEENATASTRKTSDELQKQLARYDPLLRAQQQYTKALQSIASYQESGVGTQQQISALMEGATARYQAAQKAVQGLGEAHAGLSSQGQSALHSMRSFFEQVALGISPMQAAVSQMNHLTYAASGEGGIVGAFKQAASVITDMITPMRLVGAGAVALGAGAVIAANDWRDAQQKIAQSLIGIGATTGTTVDQINKFAKDNASATGLSVSQMRDVGVAFAKTGNIVISSIEGVGEAVHGYSILTGKTATEATTDLAKALSGDLVKGAEDLNKTYGFLNPTIEENIRVLQRQGDRAGATKLILEAMSEDNRKAADSVGLLTKAWNAVANAASAAKDAIGAAVAAGPSGEEPGLIMLPRGQDPAAAARQAKQMADLAVAGADAWTKASNAIAMGAKQAIESTVPEVEQLKKVKDALADIDKQRQAASGVGPTGPTLPTAFDDKGATQALNNQKQALEQSIEASQRYNARVAEIAASWQGVGQVVALQLQQLQNQLPVIQAITGQQQMAAQYAADYANALDKGLSEAEALALASKKLELSQAAATSSVEKQVEALKDSTAMIKAQQNGTEATTAAAIAYKNAIESGADATAAASLKAATLANYMAKAAASTQAMANAYMGMFSIAGSPTTMDTLGVPYAPDYSQGPSTGVSRWSSAANTFGAGGGVAGAIPMIRLANGQMVPDNSAAGLLSKQSWDAYNNSLTTSFSDTVNQWVQSGGVASALTKTMGQQAYTDTLIGPTGQTKTGTTVTESDIESQVSSLTDLMNQQTTDKAKQLANLNTELSWLQSRPGSVQQQQQIAQLRQSIDSLAKSTDSLNATNQDLLSPYYTQDPRTSHIGFRSQGMAIGGYVDVPGGMSSNDNIIATIPVASGERIYVDPMPSRRGGSQQGVVPLTVNISSPVMIQGNADRDQIGRTLYQNNQLLAKQLRAATQ